MYGIDITGGVYRLLKSKIHRPSNKIGMIILNSKLNALQRVYNKLMKIENRKG